MGHYHKCSCGCGRNVGGAYDRYDNYGVGGAYDRKGDVGGTSYGGCGNVGGAYDRGYGCGNVGGAYDRGCGCGNVGGAYDRGCGCGGNVGGAYYNRRKCCFCYLLEPITNTLKCLFSCGRRF